MGSHDGGGPNAVCLTGWLDELEVKDFPQITASAFLWTNHTGCAGALFDTLKGQFDGIGSARYRAAFKRELQRFVLNMALATLATGEFPVGAAVSRRSADATVQKLHRGACEVSYLLFMAIQRRAEEIGLVTVYAGTWKGEGRRTILVPSADVRALVTTHLAGSHLVSLGTNGKVYLRRGAENNNGPVRFIPTPETKAMELDLRAINAVNVRFEVTLADGTAIIPWDLEFDRIFNKKSWDLGGRCYAEFQNMEREKRLTLTMDGEPVVECDFKCLHPTMLYNLQGVDYRDDPYAAIDLLGFESLKAKRDAMKPCLNAILNASSPKSAGSAIGREFSKKTKTGELKAKPRAPLPQGMTGGHVVKAFKLAHPGLERHLCSGAGLWLMRMDSDIAVAVMKRITAMGKPCLGVHDSFIVKASDQELLMQAMTEEYEQRLGFTPRIDVK